MPMSKIDKARTIVMMTNAVRDKLLSNLNDMPEEWDGFEVRQAVLETCRGEVDPITPIARRRAFEKTFFSGNFTRQKPEPDAELLYECGGCLGVATIYVGSLSAKNAHLVEEG